MKPLSCFVCALVLLAVPGSGFAASTAASKSPAPVNLALPQDPLPEPAPVVSIVKVNFDDYINELNTALKLSDDEKKAITSFYQTDGQQLQSIFNSDTLSPLEQDRQVTELHDARDAKIKTLLASDRRIAAFLPIEAKYRVGLLELAMDGGLLPPGAPVEAPAPAPAPTPAPAANPAPAPASAPAAPASSNQAPATAKTPPPE